MQTSSAFEDDDAVHTEKTIVRDLAQTVRACDALADPSPLLLSLPLQGPFSATQMQDWHNAGYFQMSLLVAPNAPENFVPLGTLVALRGGASPFAPAPGVCACAALMHL